jgi:L-rhamnose-H+ transport protein
MISLGRGLGLIASSAGANSAFAVPLKLRRSYEWENTWALCHLFAMIILPMLMAAFVLPTWRSAVGAASYSTIAIVMAFGFLWGTGSVAFAIGIDAVGVSLGYALIMGTVTAVGPTVPMLRRWPQIPFQVRMIFFAGIIVCIAGVAVCGKAGILREDESGLAKKVTAAGSSAQTKPIVIGVLWCLASALLSAGNNLGFDFADSIGDAAQRQGANPLFASLSQWIVLYWGSYLAVLTFSGAKMLKTGSWRKYLGADAGHDSGMAVTMGVLHFTCQITYGMGAYYLGRLGTSVGYAILLAGSLIMANVLGFLMGEWNLASKRSTHILYGGLMILILGVIILAYSNSLVANLT